MKFGPVGSVWQKSKKARSSLTNILIFNCVCLTSFLIMVHLLSPVIDRLFRNTDEIDLKNAETNEEKWALFVISWSSFGFHNFLPFLYLVKQS